MRSNRKLSKELEELNEDLVMSRFETEFKHLERSFIEAKNRFEDFKSLLEEVKPTPVYKRITNKLYEAFYN